LILFDMTRRLVVWIAAGCVAAAVVSAASGGAGPTAPTWAEVAPGLTAKMDPKSSNPCQRGDMSCFDIVAAELIRRETVLGCGHAALFDDLTLQTSEQISAAASGGLFQNARKMAHFDAWFVRLYFQAQDDWRAGRIARVPDAWQIAYREADKKSVNGMGDVLLGINAHVTRDLAFAVSDGFTDPGFAMDPDYLLVNKIIQRLAVAALGDVAARYDKTVLTAKIPVVLGRFGLGDLIANWRAEAWRDGAAVRHSPKSRVASLERSIELLAAARARAIAAATAYTPLVQSSAARDSYCSSHEDTPSKPVDLVPVCDFLSNCAPIVVRWTKAEGLKGRAVTGAKAFVVSGCLSCHTYLGDGRHRGKAPDLTAEARRNRGVEWQIKLLKCPTCVVVGTPMAPLPMTHVRDIAAFLEASRGPK
jgi:hypothetical protein